jgi:hypothetical protein
MPARKRHQPGKYKPKPELLPNFSGVKPLTLFQDTNGLWGAKDGDGNIEIAPIYQRAEQTESDNQQGIVRLVARDHVIAVSPDDWDLLAFFSRD